MASACGIFDAEFKSGTVTLPCSKRLKRFCLSCPFPIFKGRQGQKEIAASMASSKHVIFLCLSCVDNPAAKPASIDLAGVEKRMESVTEQISDLSKQLDNIKQNLGTFSDDAEPPNLGPGEPNQRDKRSFASVLSRNLHKHNPTVVYSDMKQAISDCMNEDYHKRSIVIAGIPVLGGEDATNAQEAQHAALAVQDLLTDMGLEHLKPEECNRMGRGKDVPDTEARKIKVLVSSHGIQQLILQSKGALRGSEKWKSVFIRASQNKSEREAEFQLRSICRRLNANLLGANWKVDIETSVKKFGVRSGKIYDFNRQSTDHSWKKGKTVKESEYPNLNE